VRTCVVFLSRNGSERDRSALHDDGLPWLCAVGR
jgi:hypothetical protein